MNYESVNGSVFCIVLARGGGGLQPEKQHSEPVQVLWHNNCWALQAAYTELGLPVQHATSGCWAAGMRHAAVTVPQEVAWQTAGGSCVCCCVMCPQMWQLWVAHVYYLPVSVGQGSGLSYSPGVGGVGNLHFLRLLAEFISSWCEVFVWCWRSPGDCPWLLEASCGSFPGSSESLGSRLLRQAVILM